MSSRNKQRNWQRATDWHKIRRNGHENKFVKPISVYQLTGTHRRTYLPEPLPLRIQHRDARGNPISLPRVTIVERYDEKGNPRCPSS